MSEQQISSPDAYLKSALDQEKENSALAFVDENIWRPTFNSLIAQPWNAVANTINGGADATGNQRCVGKIEYLHYDAAPMTTARGFAQNVASTLGSIAPYVVAAELTGGAMRTTGRVLQLEGNAARFASSRLGSAVVGAGLYDFARDTNPGESQLRNAISGAAAFGIFSGGNIYANRFGSSLAERIAIRTMVGVVGGETQSLIGHGKLSGEAALNGMIMNNLFPLAHEQFGRLNDRASHSLGKGLSIQRFIDLHDLSKSQHLPKWAVDANPLAQVKFSERNTPGPRSNTIHVNEKLVALREGEIKAAAEKSGQQLDPAEIRKQALADELGAELADLNVARQGRSGSTLTNRDILKAQMDGRIQILMDVTDAGGVKKVPLTLSEMRDRLGNNSMDIHLGNEFQHPVSEPTDFRSISPKDSLKRLKTFTVADGEGFQLQPGQSVLAFTKETICLNESPVQAAQGEPGVVARINMNSSLARHFLENHQTAPTLNNGTHNKITLEIVNNSPAPLTITPGMVFGSIVFERMSGFRSTPKFPSEMHGQTQPNGKKS